MEEDDDEGSLVDVGEGMDMGIWVCVLWLKLSLDTVWLAERVAYSVYTGGANVVGVIKGHLPIVPRSNPGLETGMRDTSSTPQMIEASSVLDKAITTATMCTSPLIVLWLPTRT